MTDDSLGHKAAIQALVVCVCDFLYTLFLGFFFLTPQDCFCFLGTLSALKKKNLFIHLAQGPC